MAYFYEHPDTSTFRYRVFNVAQTLAGRARRAARPQAGSTAATSTGWTGCWTGATCWWSAGPATPTGWRAWWSTPARAGRRVLFDVDDLVFDLDYAHLIMDTLGSDQRSEDVWNFWFAYLGRLSAAFQLCDGAVVTNPYLADRAREAFGDGRPVEIIPNYLERSQQALSQRIWDAKEASGWARDARVHLGYFSGHAHAQPGLRIDRRPARGRLMDEDPRLHLRIVGFLDLGPELARHAARVETSPLQDYLNLQRLVGETEVNLVPLQDNVFTNCKSALKWFEAAPVGTVTVATPTATYRTAIQHGQTGWLAASHAWEDVLRGVLRDIDGHLDIAKAGRASALERHGWDRQTATIQSALFGKGGRQWGESLDREAAIRALFDTSGKGLEIGPSYRPIVAKKAGFDVEIVNHGSTEELRAKYANEANVDPSNIEDIDHVWDGRPLSEVVGGKGVYDYVVASHVIEHTPDMLGFLVECELVLKPTGVLVLAVPDSRRCFDAFRPVSTAGMVLQAHHERRSRHTPGTAFDHVGYSALLDGAAGWSKGVSGVPSMGLHHAVCHGGVRPVRGLRRVFRLPCLGLHPVQLPAAGAGPERNRGPGPEGG